MNFRNYTYEKKRKYYNAVDHAHTIFYGQRM